MKFQMNLHGVEVFSHNTHIKMASSFGGNLSKVSFRAE